MDRVEQLDNQIQEFLEKLNKAGFYTCLDIRNSDYRELIVRFGRLGASLWKKSHGIDEREVVVERERKSIYNHGKFSFTFL